VQSIVTASDDTQIQNGGVMAQGVLKEKKTELFK
jgi:hypothetical protein